MSIEESHRRTEDVFKESVGRKHSDFAPINIC